MVNRKRSELALTSTAEITRAEFLEIVFGGIAPGQGGLSGPSPKPDETQCGGAPAGISGAMPKMRKW